MPEAQKPNLSPDQLSQHYEELLRRPVHSLPSLKAWFADRSQLEAQLAEQMGWLYIGYTRHTSDLQAKRAFEQFVEQIQPIHLYYSQQLNQKALRLSYIQSLAHEPGYDIYLRRIGKQTQVFCQKNIPLLTRIRLLQQQYSAIVSSMTVCIGNKELTLAQAQQLLYEPDRQLREQVYLHIAERRLQDQHLLNELFDELIALRHELACNAGYDNYRSYIWDELCRFDYTPNDCLQFHSAIQAYAVPVLNQIAHQRSQAMGLKQLRPWDWKADPQGQNPLRLFRNEDELIEKTIQCLHQIHPFFSQCLIQLQHNQHLDLAARKHKAPGGYNYPLPISKLPFIFMNATGSWEDATTLLHEIGHAIHAILMADLPLVAFTAVPAELTELAAMSMELFTIPAWHCYFDGPAPLVHLLEKQKQEVIETLTWVATIDAFQHWVYTHPKHRAQQRCQYWQQLFKKFSDQKTDWSGLEDYQAHLWQKQLHLFEAPFYYIEYGIAQLGALALWRQFRQNSILTLNRYMSALRLGYTRSVRHVYHAAGITFDLSPGYVKYILRQLQFD